MENKRQFVLEPLEPRLLLSATALGDCAVLLPPVSIHPGDADLVILDATSVKQKAQFSLSSADPSLLDVAPIESAQQNQNEQIDTPTESSQATLSSEAQNTRPSAQRAGSSSAPIR